MAAPKRPVRVANCSGAASDPPIHMYNQAYYGDVDYITGDYLAEMNLAQHAEAYANDEHPGWMPSALSGIEQTLQLANEKRIKIIVNGGGLNPMGLAEKVNELVQAKSLNLTVAYTEGDNLMRKADQILADLASGKLHHLDASNPRVHLDPDLHTFISEPSKPIIAANIYLGYRAIRASLDAGADIVICGRVSDASPVLAAAAHWHGWADDAYDQLAGALIAGHLIECSTYVTGGNFAGAYQYPIEGLLDLALPIAEIDASGECVITKHDAPGLHGFVTPDTVKCQLLYELQGSVYLNSDVSADIAGVRVRSLGPNRVHVAGATGRPPPPTTKLALFHHGGYTSEMLLNASGHSTPHKWAFQELQWRRKLAEFGLADAFTHLSFTVLGVPAADPKSQAASTTYMRVVMQAGSPDVLRKAKMAFVWNSVAPFAGLHMSLDQPAGPRAYAEYYPVLWPQSAVRERVRVLGQSEKQSYNIDVAPAAKTEPLVPRENYETANLVDVGSFGPTSRRALGDVVLARSGDKGGNVNIGLFVQTSEEWEWFRSFMTRDRMKTLMGEDWHEEHFVERVEFKEIYAVHFVIYGALGRGVSGSALLDSLGKGFAEFIRAVHVDIPVRFMSR